MSCPSGINAVLPTGNKSMSVAGQWKNPYVNVGKITSSHDKNFLFPVGTTKVTFTAKTHDGQTDSCDIRVTISGIYSHILLCFNCFFFVLQLDRCRSSDLSSRKEHRLSSQYIE